MADGGAQTQVREGEQKGGSGLLSRRRALGLGGSIGLGALIAACGGGKHVASPTGGANASPTGSKSAAIAALDKAKVCATTPEEIQGPYFFDVDKIRSDVRESRPGTRLDLVLRVLDTTICASDGSGGKPLPNAVVELWQCDAAGIYSGFEAASKQVNEGHGMQAMPKFDKQSDGSYSVGDPEAQTTDSDTYLRGAQVTDADGIARFTTIVPGWYDGRTVHIHFKVHIDKKTVMTTQLYFEDAFFTKAYAVAPYNARPNRDTLNAADAYFDPKNIMQVLPKGDGYVGVMNMGVMAY